MNVQEVENPGYEQPKKSGRGIFACFGIGCVILLVICVAGGIGTYFFFGDYIKMGMEQGQLHAESIQTAVSNEQVIEKLGDGIQPGFSFPEVMPGEDGAQTQKFRVPLNGSDGESGTLVVDYWMKPGSPVERRKFQVEIGDEVINLLESDGFDLDIDDGGHEAEVSDDSEDASHGVDLDLGSDHETEDVGEPVGAGGNG